MKQLIRIFSPYGVITRKEYILTFAGWILMAFMIRIESLLGEEINFTYHANPIIAVAMIVVIFAAYYLILVATPKRARDAKISFHIFWLFLLPLFGWFYIWGRLMGAPSILQGDAFK